MIRPPGVLVRNPSFPRQAASALAHAGFAGLAYWLAFQLRFDFNVPTSFERTMWRTLPLLVTLRVAAFAVFHVYKAIWRYIGVSDLITIAKSTLAGSVVFALSTLAFGPSVPRSVYLLETLITATLVAGSRLTARALRENKQIRQAPAGRRALIIGAGAAGEMLIRELRRNDDVSYDVVGLLDDDPRKKGARLHGVSVLGDLDALPSVVATSDIEEVVIAIPSADEETMRRIAMRAEVAGVSIKRMPSTADLLMGKAQAGQLVSASPENLLGRDAIHLDVDLLRQDLAGKRVLVTGAGGSIGSELCRQIASFAPSRLIMLDRAESALFLAAGDIARIDPTLEVRTFLCDITNRDRLAEAFERFKPEVIYHAAAYKHVSLMEAQPLDAIENNVFGTENVAKMAIEHGAERFVFISTDKAVRPVGIMGMSKRVAEDLLLSLEASKTKFVAVRFGNVLGSDGSVLPIFERQLKSGGPITVTNPDATRYFMLISEAAQLVLQAGSMGQGGEVFFLDMGEPVRIGDLAENFIRLSGLTPGHDIKIQVVGLRPGERLNEELVREQEKLMPSMHEKVMVVAHETGLDEPAYRADLDKLRALSAAREAAGAEALLRDLARRH